MQEDSELQASG